MPKNIITIFILKTLQYLTEASTDRSSIKQLANLAAVYNKLIRIINSIFYIHKDSAYLHFPRLDRSI